MNKEILNMCTADKEVVHSTVVDSNDSRTDKTIRILETDDTKAYFEAQILKRFTTKL
jgi:hypothetical protein